MNGYPLPMYKPALLATLALLLAMHGFAQQKPTRIRVSAGVLVGFLDKSSLPVYPRTARQKAIAGDVIFKVLVDETGKIVLSEPVEGDPLLVAASIDALREFRYRPYRLMGSPISVESQVGFHFSKDGKVEALSDVSFRPEFRTGVVNADGTYVLWPRKIGGDDPKLPPELAGKSGAVYLTATVGTDGSVTDVRVTGGDQSFIEPVLVAVKQYKYEPQLVGGQAAPATIAMSFHFGDSR